MASLINNEAGGVLQACSCTRSYLRPDSDQQDGSGDGGGKASSASGVFSENQASPTDSFICCDVDSWSGVIRCSGPPPHTHMTSTCHSLSGPDAAPSDSQQHAHILHKTVFTRKTQKSKNASDGMMQAPESERRLPLARYASHHGEPRRVYQRND